MWPGSPSLSVVSSAPARLSRKHPLRCLLIVLALGCLWPYGRAAANPVLEVMLMQAISDIRHGKLQAAERSIDQIIALYPNYRLAHLIKGDLLLARSRPLSTLGQVPEDTLRQQVPVPLPFQPRRPQFQAASEALQDLRAELQARLARLPDASLRNKVPAGLWRLAPDMPHVFVLDAERSRLHVLENRNGILSHVADFYASVGKLGTGKQREGDKRTPTGSYLLTGAVPRDRLNDFYGGAAFELDFPSPWDVRAGRTGSGIWLHGTPPSTFARAPKASDGCIVVSNPDLTALSRFIVPGKTPFLIQERVEWIDRDSAYRQAQGILTAFERWRTDFVARDTERIAQHYFGARRTSASREEAGRIMPVSTHRRLSLPHPIAVSQVSALQVPGESNLVMVEFDRTLAEHRDRVRQYWQLIDGRWQIVHESAR